MFCPSCHLLRKQYSDSSCPEELNREIEECIKNKTFSLGDTVKSVFHGVAKKKTITPSNFFIPNFVFPMLGMCHTFIYPEQLEADRLTDGLACQLDLLLDIE